MQGPPPSFHPLNGSIADPEAFTTPTAERVHQRALTLLLCDHAVALQGIRNGHSLAAAKEKPLFNIII